MTSASGRCIVCGGGPTVKAHLLPRALVLEIRADSPHVVEGSRFRDGYTPRQNGPWDDELLCLAHEKASGRGDKYAIELIRNFARDSTPGEGGSHLMPNPKPELLSHFVHATVWKTVVSNHGRQAGVSLGPYEPLIRSIVFDGNDAHLPFMVSRNVFRLAGEDLRVGVLPHPQKLADRRTWLFAIGGLQFFLKTDQRAFPADWKPYLGNDNDPLVLTDVSEMDIRKVPILRPIFDRMAKRSRSPR